MVFWEFGVFFPFESAMNRPLGVSYVLVSMCWLSLQIVWSSLSFRLFVLLASLSVCCSLLLCV